MSTSHEENEGIDSHQTSISAWIRGRPIPVEAVVAIKKLTAIEVEDWTIDADESGPAGALTPTGTE